MTRKKPELLVPASSLEVLKTAVRFGADAVYIGGEAFGLRAKAKNFSMEDMAEGIAFAHRHRVKVYVTANILAHNDDLESAEEYFRELRDMKPFPADALIISDPGMFVLAKRVWPQVEIHISTQANNTNYGTYLFWWAQGAKRVVSARELSLKEIREIREHIPAEMEIESFVHGAMCISYSGRCLLSNYFTGRDANQGACTHPCRWKYAVVEETRPGEYMPVYENERGTFLFNAKDLCMIEHIPELLEAGIDSLKIEGRMKTALYVAVVARTYRRAIDDYLEDEEKYRKNMDWYRAEIAKCTYRQFSTGFYFGKPDETSQIYDNSTYVSEYTYLGIVEEVKDSLARIEQRNKFCAGDMIEIMKPDGSNVPVTVEAIYNAREERVDSAPHPRELLWVKLSHTPEPFDLLRVQKGLR
ncbi:MAG TPA: U32 family peptidase [Candidatus Acetatifactor stercoripullorum]|uniref:U32 family peptidase n=1 Tax=Candidatus Acetatifactor stercoripullorum TaxID=2838414 RepID=A0A9D1R4H5_9FIRM|nr:U32 family peptidase [Candidatus Acetatifactor stercoripullorum]HIW79976.1 U32 family peptidase [Candidatus Acetatifactor stercoripullorum]